MVFGLFSSKSNKEKLLEKGKKFAAQGRTAEAMTYFEDALDLDPDFAEAKSLLRDCREHLVLMNLEEAGALAQIDPEKAAEHARLAFQLAGDDRELAAKAGDALSNIAKSAPKLPKKEAKEEPPKRLFEPSCGGGCGPSSCGPSCGEGGDEDGEFHEDPDDLYYFYLEAADAEEKEALEEMGESFRRAYVSLQQGDTSEAARWLSLAKSQEKNQIAIHYLSGMLAWQKGDGGAANKHLLEASCGNPPFGPALKRRAILLREAKMFREAVEAIEPRVKSHPKDEEALTLYSAALAEAGRADEAVEAFGDYARKAMKTNAGVALLWAHILLAASNTDEAITALRIAVALAPDALEAQEILGIQLTRKGGRDAEGAVKAFKHCYRANTERGWYYLLRIAEAYAAMGQNGEAGKFLEEARNELPESEDARKVWETVAAGLALRG